MDAYGLGQMLGRLIFVVVFVGGAAWATYALARRSRRRWLWVSLAAFVALLLMVAVLLRLAGFRVVDEVDPTRALVAAEGLRLAPPPADQVRDAVARLRADPEMGDEILDVQVRLLVGEDDRQLGSATVIAVEGAAAGDPAIDRQFATGAAQASGTTPSAARLAGEDVFEFTAAAGPAPGLRWIVWVQQNLVCTVAALDEPTAEAQVSAMVRAIRAA